MSSSSLAAISLSQVTDQLHQYGSSLQGEHRLAVHALLEALEDGLRGTLSPHYHLSAIDPGVGKSLTVATFLKVWKELGFNPSSSILIGLSRLEEIRTYLQAAGLDRQDVAVLTSKPEFNELGAPEDQYGSAPIMFTTQQMIERRTRDRLFAEADEFHYKGRPRALRVWDESLVPAEQLTVSVDELGTLPIATRRQSPAYAAAVQSMLPGLWELKDGEKFTIPANLADAPARSRSSIGSAALIEDLTRMAGQEVTAVHIALGDVHLLGVGQPLPNDFTPVVILDASGRVRSTYDVWEAAGGPLRRLPSATKDYSNLRVHLWERAVGRVAMRTPGAVEDVVDALAEIIAEDGKSEWLVVHYNDQPFQPLLRDSVRPEQRDRLHFLTWGMHHGTNAFADCKKVVLIGQLTYGALGYRALAAACGASVDDEDVQDELRVGEYRHHLLQALTRASARHSRNGLAGTCTAYVVASPNIGARGLLREVFPGCMVERWSPDVPEVGGRAGQLLELLEQARAQRVPEVAKSELRTALGLTTSNFSRLLKQRDVLRYLNSRGLRVDRYAIAVPPGFETYLGGGFTVNELDDEPQIDAAVD
ncbi:hypothetical protein [Altererythrobacter sp. TH136]|uniref:hypothetical protein n=1 Tax=Altererythrobacter sp. TH136 TaxID=2067415 RepID=UPI00116349BD|nr:hypothetical protein [Altererythrobacter sp. TH136]QDM40613.1 hypothetical protein C0V74_05830 [Altererythrobacter sp. TH136]